MSKTKIFFDRIINYNLSAGKACIIYFSAAVSFSIYWSLNFEQLIEKETQEIQIPAEILCHLTLALLCFIHFKVVRLKFFHCIIFVVIVAFSSLISTLILHALATSFRINLSFVFFYGLAYPTITILLINKAKANF